MSLANDSLNELSLRHSSATQTQLGKHISVQYPPLQQCRSMYYPVYYNNLSITITMANVAFRCSNPVIRAHYRVLRRQIRLCLRYQLSPHIFPKYASRKLQRMLQPGTALFLLRITSPASSHLPGRSTRNEIVI